MMSADNPQGNTVSEARASTLDVAAGTIFCHAQFKGDDYTARQLAKTILADAQKASNALEAAAREALWILDRLIEANPTIGAGDIYFKAVACSSRLRIVIAKATGTTDTQRDSVNEQRAEGK